MAAAIEHLLFHTRRIPRSQISHLFLRQTLTRPFSSSESDPPQPQPNDAPSRTFPNPQQPVEIQPVSYAIKPKLEDQHSPENARSFSREDIRYVKDSPEMSPASYVNRVAPLPEYMAEPHDREDNIAEFERERSRRMQTGNRQFRFRVVDEEKDNEVPFPTLIKVEKKQAERTVFDLQEAIRQVKANAKRNFDETVEAHVNLGIDRRRSDLGVSGAVVLPHGTGKVVKVAVFADGAAADEARAAGADIVGADELIEEIKTSGKINFDKCIATHSMMQRVTKIGKILRGLTPNAKRGTVTNNVAVAVKEAKQGLLDFRMKDSIVHVGLGKASFPEESLHENIGAFVNALLLAKPAGLKKTSKYAGYVNSFHLCSTMGPGFPISIQSLSKAADVYTKSRPQ